MTTIREQATELHCTYLERRNMLERQESLPVGRGGLDPAEIRRKRMRLEALQEAAENMGKWADKVDAREDAE